ncbi:hypothetical protein ACVIG9_000567 [Bradyrhizobium ottawaense]
MLRIAGSAALQSRGTRAECGARSLHRHCDAPMHIPACSVVGWAKAHSAVPTNSIAVRGWWARCALPTLRYRVCGTQLSSQTHLRGLAADFARALLQLSTLQSKRAQGRPGASSHPRSAARNAHAERTAQQHTGGAEHSAFPARWSDGLCRALPGAELSFWPPSPRELDDAVCPVGARSHLRGSLTVATTARTTRFCRTRSASLVRTRFRAHRDDPPCPLPFRADAAASTATRLAKRDDARSPLKVKPGWTTHTSKPNFGKVEYF